MGRDPRYAGGPAGLGGPGRPGVPGADERTQAMGMPAGGRRGDADGQSTEAIQTGGRRRRPPARGGRGPGGPGGPGGPEGPGGRGPRDPRDFDDFDEDDEKPRRTGWKRFLPSWKILVAAFTVLAVGTFGMIAVAYANTPTPTATQADAIAEGSAIYYNDGKTLIAKVGTPRVIVNDIKKVPRHVQDAVIAIENKTFRDDSGISIPGMVRSVWMTATGQQLQGASTITQQMARNYYDGLSQEVSIKRKFKEIFVAVKLDQEMTKDQILLQYLNTVNFGRAYGIEAAAMAYFKKHVDQLTPEQGAYLAARIQTPALDADSPQLQGRFKDVINAMAALDPAKYGELPGTAKFPKPVKESNANYLGGLKGYMVIQVLQELKTRMNLSPDQVRSGGYKIISTFDKRLMQAAKKAVTATTSTMSKEFHAGLAAVDPQTGRVLAFYGGNDYVKDPWNEPFDSKKQAASAFKPYVLAAWLDAGYSLNSWLPGNQTVPKELPGQAKGGITNGHSVPAAINAIYATSHSINTAFASMAYKLDEANGTIGQLSAVKQIAEEAGLDKSRLENDIKEHKYQFSIGSALVTPVEQAAGYSIFANEGKHVDYHVVKEVRKDKDVVIAERREVKQVITPEAAADSVAAMEEVLKSGTAAGKGIGRPAAGKTGTNNDEKEAWFVGFTPQLSVAVGMYREQCVTKSGKTVQPLYSNCPTTPGGKPSKKYGPNNPYTHVKEVSLGFEGAGPPTTIWRTFMMEALAGKPVEQFPQKAGLGSPENIVPSPTPTPSPEPDDGGFPNDIPNDFLDDNGCYDGGPGCDNGHGGGRGFGDDPGQGGQDGGPGAGNDVPLNIPAAMPSGPGAGKDGSGA
ncbi:transglycosylase domain-containing protein [Microbispora sp. H10836]|uniref:transglycosylase domain-containing protein n=1 Tax=Microbispora sp. H10836 TaxID=2729106 RepID=UPI001474EBF0|nr:transglycosylase domain-containing protein [Microbispora sp. H10836]